MSRSRRKHVSLAAFISLALLATQSVVAAAAPASQPATTQAAVLSAGDPAPPLTVDRWLKGEPVAAFAPGTVYVVDFWATWCGPCVASFPELNELVALYPKVVFIGVDIWETDPTAVGSFVERMGKRMQFRVAADRFVKPAREDLTAYGPMAESWLRAADRGGIPCWFIVGGDGHIAAINDGELAETLPAVLNGTYNAAASADRRAKVMAVWPRLSAVLNGRGNNDEKLAALDELEKVDGGRRALWRVGVLIAKGALDEAQREFEQHVDTRRPDQMTRAQRAQVERARMELALARGDKPAVANQVTLLAQLWDQSPIMLNALAWACTSDSKIWPELRAMGIDRAVALRIAQRAVEQGGDTDAGTLDTLARCYALNDDFARAIATEEKALAANKREADQATFERALECYRAGKVE